ncbi:MAG TPA: hypothetical protein VK689_18815 [Armatimonadota bacterium]|nr:hypothetical protein [Armatimonadota bacterium]
MTLVLNLPPDIEAQLAAHATENGVEPSEYALQLLRASLPNTGDTHSAAPAAEMPEDPTVALLRQWREEWNTMTPEEIRRAEAELEELKDALNANRREAGMRLLFP